MHILDKHSFSNLLSTLPKRCVLLIEDFNKNSVAAKRTSISHHNTSDKQKINPISSLSLSTILNAFNGLTATEGQILILTTNHKENIDPALLQPGRINKTFNFEHPNSDTIQRHFLSIYDDTPSVTRDQLEAYTDKFTQYQSRKSTTQTKFQEYFIRHQERPGDTINKVALQSENKVQSH
jgi:chaperone BCS1